MSKLTQELINFRTIVNDVCVHPWEPMPEAGETLQDLADFLETCGASHDILGERWDYRRLRHGGTFNRHIVSYGLRAQFWMPTPPSPEEFKWSTDEGCENLTVECCGDTLCAYEDDDRSAIMCEEGYMFRCRKCGKHTRRANGKVHRTVQAAYDYWMRVGTKIYTGSI